MKCGMAVEGGATGSVDGDGGGELILGGEDWGGERWGGVVLVTHSPRCSLVCTLPYF